MINRMKFLTVLFSVLGLSGCIVVDDEVPVYYSSYPAGSYESAIDYYHRPPRPNVSRHGHNVSIHKKEPHLNKPKHITKPDHHKDVKHSVTKPNHLKTPDHSITKPGHPIKEKVPQLSIHPVPQTETVKKPEPKQPKQPVEKFHKKKMPESLPGKSNPAKSAKPKTHHHR